MKKNNGNLNYEDAWKLAKAFYDERAALVEEQISKAPEIKIDINSPGEESSDGKNPDLK